MPFPPLELLTTPIGNRQVFLSILHFQARCQRLEPVATYCRTSEVSPARLRQLLVDEGGGNAREARMLGILLRASQLLDTSALSITRCFP